MFLSEVYKHSKILLFIFLLAIIGQLFINYKQGIVVSPFFHYGMYSGRFSINRSYQILEVWQNGKMLQGQTFTPEQWDKIMLPLQYYAGIKTSNELYDRDINRILLKMHISTNDKNFISSCNYIGFENWYKKYLTSITHQAVENLAINYRTYQYESKKLVPTASTISLAQLCY